MYVCYRIWIYDFEVHVVESVFDVTSARQCDVWAD